MFIFSDRRPPIKTTNTPMKMKSVREFTSKDWPLLLSMTCFRMHFLLQNLCFQRLFFKKILHYTRLQIFTLHGKIQGLIKNTSTDIDN